jgi:hypothetical protein
MVQDYLEDTILYPAAVVIQAPGNSRPPWGVGDVITDQVTQGLAIGGHGSVSIEERPVGRLAAEVGDQPLDLAVHITLAPKKLIRTRRASEGSVSEPSLARRVSMC